MSQSTDVLLRADTYLRHTSLHSSSSRVHKYKPRQTYQQTHSQHSLSLHTVYWYTHPPANTHLYCSRNIAQSANSSDNKINSQQE